MLFPLLILLCSLVCKVLTIFDKGYRMALLLPLYLYPPVHFLWLIFFLPLLLISLRYFSIEFNFFFNCPKLIFSKGVTSGIVFLSSSSSSLNATKTDSEFQVATPSSFTSPYLRNGWTWDFKNISMIYIYQLFIDLYKISSSSCRAGNTDIPDPLSPLLPIVHRFLQVLRATSRILT